MFTKQDFGSDFHWGVATAAYQIEGAHNIYGKGLSIWDDFVSKKGKIFNQQTGNVSCDFYHRYIEDLHILKSLNFKNFRFSISWSRILPFGTGEINQEGIDFYNRLIDLCLELEIVPWITLYHWDLPLELEKKGGWQNRDVLIWFEEYVNLVTRIFGDRVKNWMVLNEPMVFTGAGYFLGIHAPGKRGLSSFLKTMHHATLAQGVGGRIIKSNVDNAYVGTTYSCSHITPINDLDKNIKAAKKIDALLNRIYIEPIVGLGYPIDDLKVLRRVEKYFMPEDEKNMAFEFDFIGVQNYTREVVEHSFFTPLIQAKLIPADKRNVLVRTLMNWEVHPKSIYHMLKRFSQYPLVNDILITENGAAFKDKVTNDRVHDWHRTSFLQSYLHQVLRAKNKGINVKGYFVWTFTDNFEWAEGYFPRFGLVHINFKTQKRIVKDSGLWFQKFLEE